MEEEEAGGGSVAYSPCEGKEVMPKWQSSEVVSPCQPKKKKKGRKKLGTKRLRGALGANSSPKVSPIATPVHLSKSERSRAS